MTIRDEDQLRAWCVDYAIRLRPTRETAEPEAVIADAIKIEQYITARPPCDIRLLIEPAKSPPPPIEPPTDYCKLKDGK